MDARQSLRWDVVSPPAAVSTCELELDCIASDIMNGYCTSPAPFTAHALMQTVALVSTATYVALSVVSETHTE